MSDDSISEASIEENGTQNQEVLDVVNPPATPADVGGPDLSQNGGNFSGEDTNRDLNADDTAEDRDLNLEAQSVDEIMILDPNHPLMIRFQRQLQAHLTKQREKCELETATLEEQLKNTKERREEIGVRLYERQQELAMLQANLEELTEKLTAKSLANETIMYDMDQQREMVQKMTEKQIEEAKTVGRLLKETDELGLKLFYVEKAHACQTDDVSLIGRTVDKARKEAGHYQNDKQTQDFFLNRMSEESARIEREIDTLNTKCVAQKTEKEAAQDILRDAEGEIQKAELERGKILQQWNSALLGMKNRNEIYSEMLDSINDVKKNILTCQCEIQHCKISTEKEQLTNEQLTQVLHRIHVLVANTNKQLSLEHSRYECLKVEYTTYSAMLQETENGLNKYNYDLHRDRKTYESLFGGLEKAQLRRIELEGEIKAKIRERLSVSKAAKYNKKISVKLSDQTQELESEIAKIDNKIAERTLEKFEHEAAFLVSRKKMEELEKTVEARNGDINLSETQVSRRIRVIERKQQTIQLLNKGLETLIEQSGGLELSPIERQLHHYKSDLKAREAEIKSLQNGWLRSQRQLVHFSEISQEEKRRIDSLRRQFTVLSKKKIRIERGIDAELGEISAVERDVLHMQGDIEKLNGLVCAKRKAEEEFLTNTILKEKDFVKQLKAAEDEAMRMEERLGDLKEAKERIFQDLVDSEKEVLLWEKRNRLTKETKETVQQDVDHGEIKAMKCEIHRMEVGLKHLRRNQEILIQETEKAVSRRETIWTKGEVISRDKMAVNSALKKINELRRKIKALKQESKSITEEVARVDGEIEAVRSSLDIKELKHINDSHKIASTKLDELTMEKAQIANALIRLQKRGKNYETVISGKYKRRVKSPGQLDGDYDQAVERRNKLTSLAESLSKEYPHLTSQLIVIDKLVKII